MSLFHQDTQKEKKRKNKSAWQKPAIRGTPQVGRGRQVLLLRAGWFCGTRLAVFARDPAEV
jgi:hypothetical protein